MKLIFATAVLAGLARAATIGERDDPVVASLTTNTQCQKDPVFGVPNIVLTNFFAKFDVPDPKNSGYRVATVAFQLNQQGLCSIKDQKGVSSGKQGNMDTYRLPAIPATKCVPPNQDTTFSVTRTNNNGIEISVVNDAGWRAKRVIDSSELQLDDAGFEHYTGSINLDAY